MYPAIDIFGLRIFTYGLMISIGLIFAIYLFLKNSKRKGYNEDHIFNMSIICIIGGVIGAKLLYIIVEFREIIKEPSIIISDFGNGFVFYGAVIGGAVAAYVYSRWKRWSFLKIFDLAAASIPLAQAFGRIGCFFAGCCYGRETDSFIGIQLNNSNYAPHDVNLIPTQLISSAGNFLIFFIVLWYYKNRNDRDGRTGALYMILYSIGRFSIEFLRGDPRGTVLNILSTSQFICIFVFIAGVLLFLNAPAKAAGAENVPPAGTV